MSKYWITPSENYSLLIDRQVRLFFLNTNKEASKPMDRVFAGITNEAAAIVIGHHPIDDPMHHDRTSLPRSNIIALRSRPFETYICGHDPVLKHKEEGKRSHIVVGTSGGLITWRYSDLQNAVAMNGLNGRGNTPTDPFNEKLYGFARITIMKNSDTKQVEFFTFDYNRYGAFHWEDPIKQTLYSHDEQHSFGFD
ncbi:unnamed protein product [Albugo candida]|uniref:Calcineurin-like phosphoesterase domain-containing protein n=1 Tax=Albugo candida TaxID=65357 RepID=A0A024FUF3_9STRA|nr:unnamed protein product [Albugo candida]|eukprot:CCI10788.1 unnamed protein product [Albugo candida]